MQTSRPLLHLPASEELRAYWQEVLTSTFPSLKEHPSIRDLRSFVGGYTVHLLAGFVHNGTITTQVQDDTMQQFEIVDMSGPHEAALDVLAYARSVGAALGFPACYVQHGDRYPGPHDCSFSLSWSLPRAIGPNWYLVGPSEEGDVHG